MDYFLLQKPKFNIIVLILLFVGLVVSGIVQARLISEVIPKNLNPNPTSGWNIGTPGNSGTVAYSININTPPAPRGFRPIVGLKYSSDSKNGPVGIGWSIPNSNIQRRIGHGGLDYAGEEFVFNGVESSGRLVKVGANSIFPSADEYRLEFEDGLALRFFLHSAEDSVSHIWSMLDKDQTISYFGESTSSQISDGANGSDRRVFQWNVSRRVDFHGNDILYEYVPQDFESSETSYLDKISYGEATVEFTYSGDPGDIDRPDGFINHYSGFPQKVSRYLKSITSFFDGTQAYKYNFGFRINDLTSHLLLAGVQQEGRQGGLLPATEFVYSGEEVEAVPFEPPPSSGAENRPFTPKVIEDLSEALEYPVGGPTETETGLLEPWFPADFNGDGCTDILHLVDNTTVRVWLGLPNGSFDLQPEWDTVYDMSGNMNDPEDGNGNIYRYEIQFGDFNGDSAADVFIILDNHVANIWFSTFDTNGDFNNFTRVEVNAPRLDRPPYSEESFAFEMPDDPRSAAGYHVRYNFKIGDFNNDGRDDLLSFYPQCNDCGMGNSKGYFFILYSEGDGNFEKQEFYEQLGGAAFPYDFGLPLMENPSDPGNCVNPTYAGRADYSLFPIDVNSDGLVDLVHPRCREAVDVFLNQGPEPGVEFSTSFERVTLSTEDPNHWWGSLGSASNDFRIQAGDFNGDGVVDLVHELFPQTDDTEYYILFGSNDWRGDEFQYLGGEDPVEWTGFGDLFEEPIWTGDFLTGLSSNWCSIEDFNGDGKSDFSNINPLDIYVQGFNVIWRDYYQFIGIGDGTFSHTHPLNGPLWMTHQHFEGQPGIGESGCYWIAEFLDSPGGPNCETNVYPISPSGEFPGLLEDGFWRTEDFNGDGMSDILNLDSNYLKNFNTQLQNTSPDLLVKVVESDSVIAEISYLSSAEMANTRMGFAKTVPVEITEYDGVGGSHSKYLEYAGGVYDHIREEFSGFATVTQTDNHGVQIESHYHQEQSLRGRPHLRISFSSGGDTLNVRNEHWSSVATGPATFASLDSVVITTYLDGESSSNDFVQKLEYEYDTEHYGVTLVRTTGTGMEDWVFYVSGFGEASEQLTTYQKLMDWKWVETSKTTTGNITGVSRQNFYSYNPYDNTLIQTSTGYGGQNSYTTTFWYTEHGNLQRQNVDQGTDTEFEYDPTGTMVIRKIRHSIPSTTFTDSFVVDPGLNLVTHHWSPNGELVHNEYDEFGRLIASTTYPGTPDNPGEIIEGFSPDISMEFYDQEVPRRIVISERLSLQGDDDDYSNREELFDLSRELVQTTTLATPGDLGQPRYTVVRSINDHANRRTAIYGPFHSFVTGLIPESDVPDSSRLTVTYYDDLGRPARNERRVREHGMVEAIYDYGPNNVLVESPGGRDKRYVFNSAGRIVSSYASMDNSNDVAEMKYMYNTSGDVTKVIGPGTNGTVVREYDRIGNITAEIDPDIGRKEFLWYPTGNLLRVIEPDNETTLYFQDSHGRKTQTDFLRDSSQDNLDYDEPEAENSLTRLTQVVGANYSWSGLEFDIYGNCVRDSVQIGVLGSFLSEYVFRADGKLVNLVYPGEGSATYSYYPGTNILQSARLDYDSSKLRIEFKDHVPTGAPRLVEYFAGNDTDPFVKLSRDIGNADGMLYRITAVANPSALADTILDLKYSYLPDGNPGFIWDRSKSENAGLTLPFFETRYEFDHLGRLLKEFDNGASKASREVTYDPGRARFGTQRSGSRTLTYNYDSVHPHRPESISIAQDTYSFGYDGRGNIISDTHLQNMITPLNRNMTFDARGQISQVVIPLTGGLPDIVENYLYSPLGALVKQWGSSGEETLRPYAFFEQSINNEIRYLNPGGVLEGFIDHYGFQKTIAVFVRDRRDNVRKVVKSDGSTMSEFEYNSWGQETLSRPGDNSYRRINSKVFHPRTVLHDFGPRKYDSSYALFLAPDEFNSNVFDAVDLNRYAYCRFNPVRHVDRTGNYVEIAWDVTNVGIGVVSLRSNIKQGKVGAAIVDGIGIVVDTGAAIAPLIPAGASTAIKAYRAGDTMASVVQWGNRIGDPVKKAASEALNLIEGASKNLWNKRPGWLKLGRKIVPKADEGVIYWVDGSKTISGKPYIGRSDDLAKRTKSANDGRDRSDAKILAVYKKGDIEEARKLEQQAINEAGGVSELDNMRNEIAPNKWEESGVQNR